MKRLYWLLNKPWVSWPIVLRAIKVSLHKRRLKEQEHIEWARALTRLERHPHSLPYHYGSARHRDWNT